MVLQGRALTPHGPWQVLHEAMTKLRADMDAMLARVKVRIGRQPPASPGCL